MSLESAALRVSAQRWMVVGLEQYVVGEDLDFAVHHVCVGTEHLMKAYLSSRHPALVVEGGNFDSLLHATGLGDNALVPLSGTRSIGGAEAFKRCKQLLKTALPVDRSDFEPLLSARNGVSHIGHLDPAKARENLIVAFRVAGPLLTALNVDADAFWTGFDDLRVELLAEHANDSKIEYQRHVAKARLTLEQRAEQRFILEQFARQHPQDNESWPFDCPVCGAQGELSGDFGVDGSGTDRVVVLFPRWFTCSVCDLRLWSTEFEFPDPPVPYEVETDWDPDDIITGEYIRPPEA